MDTYYHTVVRNESKLANGQDSVILLHAIQVTLYSTDYFFRTSCSFLGLPGRQEGGARDWGAKLFGVTALAKLAK